MPALGRRRPSALNIWPGFVDALATLLLVLMFVVLVFVLAQFFLSEALSGRDTALRQLRGQVDELARVLALERTAKDELAVRVGRLDSELAASLAQRRDLEAKASASDARVAGLIGDIAALRALKEELEREITGLAGRSQAAEGALIEEKKLSESARAQVALLNQQLAALRAQLGEIAGLLEASEKKSREQASEIKNLGERLNAALASKVEELARYRSEFFGRLRQILGDRPDVRVVGDRFVFPAEVLFPSGSADIEPVGQAQIARIGQLLNDLAKRMPPDLDWVLQVEGHTDRRPISTAQYASNWELSTARAVSVIRLLTEAGIPPSRLAAAGYGEFRPIDPGDSEASWRRNRRIELKLTQR